MIGPFKNQVSRLGAQDSPDQAILNRDTDWRNSSAIRDKVSHLLCCRSGPLSGLLGHRKNVLDIASHHVC